MYAHLQYIDNYLGFSLIAVYFKNYGIYGFSLIVGTTGNIFVHSYSTSTFGWN